MMIVNVIKESFIIMIFLIIMNVMDAYGHNPYDNY